MPGIVSLHVVHGPLAGRSFRFEEHELVVVGRSKDCRVRLPKDDKSASRHHFLLEINPPDVVLKDLGSRHGTRVDGRIVGGRAATHPPDRVDTHQTETVVVASGSRFQAGKTVFRVEIDVPDLCSRCGLPTEPGRPCVDCPRETATEPRPKTEPVAVALQCTRCGSDVSMELSSGRRGSYVCRECRSGIESDPLRAAGARAAAPLPPDVRRMSIPGYQILDRIGIGGMGAVYLAKREKDNLWVALKVLLAKVAVDEKARMRFSRESSIVEQLHHDHIVQFYDRGSVGPAFYFTMEFCPGGSVSELMARRGGKLSVSQATPIMLQTLDALDYAHHRELVVDLPDGEQARLTGVVHRDVKPDNILLTGSDRCWIAKLSDFGLAKSFTAAGLSGCTVSGQLAGALPYMPPEQVRDFRHLTPVSDVWSAGATFYAMLAGTDPRGLRGHENPLQAILRGKAVPIQEVNPDIPDALARVLGKALAHAPEERYPHAGAMRKALTGALYREQGAKPLTAETFDSEVGSGTLLVSLSHHLGAKPCALFYVGVGPIASTGDEELVRRLHDLHMALRSQPNGDAVRILKCLGTGFFGICDDVQEAVTLVRGVQILGEEGSEPLRRAVHWGSVRERPRGDLVGVDLERLVAVQALEESDRTPDIPRGSALPRGSRLLVTRAALERLPAARRAGLVPAGSFELRGFDEPQDIWFEKLDATQF